MSSEEMKKFRKIINEDNTPAWVRKKNAQPTASWSDPTGNDKTPAHVRKANASHKTDTTKSLEPRERDRRPGHQIRRDNLSDLYGKSFDDGSDTTPIFLKKQASESKKLDHLQKRIDRALKEALREMNRTHQAVYESVTKVEKLETLQAEINSIKKKKGSYGKEEQLDTLKKQIKTLKSDKKE